MVQKSTMLFILSAVLPLTLILILLTWQPSPLTKTNVPYVIFTFDDASNIDEIVVNVLPTFNEKGWKGIVYPQSVSFEHIRANLQLLVGNGWEIGSHTHTHANLSQVSMEQLELEISMPKQLFETLEGVEEVQTFAYPYGEGWDNKTVYSVVREYYRYERPADESGQEKHEFQDPLGVSFPVNIKYGAVENAQKALDFARTNNRNVWLVLHRVAEDVTESHSSDCTTQDFLEVARIVADSGLKVATTEDLHRDIESWMKYTCRRRDECTQSKNILRACTHNKERVDVNTSISRPHKPPAFALTLVQQQKSESKIHNYYW